MSRLNAKRPTDNLVLRIDEYDPITNDLLNRFYVLYDTRKTNYVIRGKQSLHSWQTHSFYCDKTKDLVSFFEVIMGARNSWNYRLYNFDDMLEFADDITFDFLDHWAEEDYLLAVHEDLVYSKSFLKKMLKIVRNVYNYY